MANIKSAEKRAKQAVRRRDYSLSARPRLRTSIKRVVNAVGAGKKDEAVAALKLEADSLAFIQYTSGTTGSPKGVMVTHGNIMANLRALQEAIECSSADTFVNWLPLFQDLGLIGTVLLPLYSGARSVLMSPASFVQSPISWLEAITRLRGTVCGGPNFAYELCVERIGQPSFKTSSCRAGGWRSTRLSRCRQRRWRASPKSLPPPALRDGLSILRTAWRRRRYFSLAGSRCTGR